jgi:hypothetical protein
MVRAKRSRVSSIPKKEKVSRALQNVRKFFPDVKFVEDADSSIKVEVTPRDVATSKRKAHSECAMAVACKRSKHVDGVIIATSTAYLVKGDTAKRFYVPTSVAREVVSFDRGSEFMPGEYELRAPGPTEQLGRQTGGHAGREGHGKPIIHRHMTSNVRAVLGSDNVR